MPLRHRILQELLLFIFLAPCLEADLARPWLGEVLATDASSEFGFGLSAMRCSPHMARSIGRLAAQPGTYVVLDNDDGSEVPLPKAGKPHRLGIPMSKFRTKLSLRKQYQAHSGALEAAGVSIMLRWLLRSPCKHSRRIAALVDAQAVIGAVTKGRSSAPTLRAEVRRIASLTLAGDFLVRYVYVPTSCNPADKPSRGIVKKNPLFSKRV